MRNKLVLTLLFSLWANSAFAALALDGSVISVSPATLTTTHSNDVIICDIKYTDTKAKTVSGGGLNWLPRYQSGVALSQVGADEWYAVAPNPLTSTPISWTGAASSGSATCFGISGADTANPFDASSTLPAAVTDILTNSKTLTISTNNPTDMLISYTAGNGLSANDPSGFTNIKTSSFQLASYEIISSAQVNLGVTYTSAGNTMIVDAIKQAAKTPYFFMGAP